MKLTQRQQEIIDFLRAEHRRTGIMPSTREIQEHFGFKSQTAAVSHLKALEKKNVITRLEGKARGLIFNDSLDREPIVDIPIYGSIPAGYGDDTEPQSDGCLSVDTHSMGVSPNAKTYALRVRGDSMINAHILDGDHVVIESKDPREYDVVAALIDGETTLKRYVMKDQHPYLKAENPKYPDLIPAQELIIQGVMVGLVRGSSRRW
ncbi:MAG: transcriptional repressor LexA [Verrucomicrobiales bacterium]|nr:transcriptional repressor LexA [Verrucomicrobiales bacterium]